MQLNRSSPKTDSRMLVPMIFITHQNMMITSFLLKWFQHTGLKINRINVQFSLVQKQVISAGHWFAKIHQIKKLAVLNLLMGHFGNQILQLLRMLLMKPVNEHDIFDRLRHGTYAFLFKYRFWMRTPVIDHFQTIWKRPAPMSTDSQKFLTILKNSRKLGLPTMEWQIWPLGYRMLNLGKFSKNCKVGCVFSIIPPECRMKQ